MNTVPIKRHESLKNLSRERHDGLMFALRLQKDVAKKAKLEDMESYAKWFWEHHFTPHFKMEEEHLFPMFDDKNKLVLKAKQQHQKLESLFKTQPKTFEDFKNIYELLQQHIRFEERELFKVIQENLTKKQLDKYQKLHSSQLGCGVWANEFWVS